MSGMGSVRLEELRGVRVGWMAWLVPDPPAAALAYERVPPQNPTAPEFPTRENPIIEFTPREGCPYGSYDYLDIHYRDEKGWWVIETWSRTKPGHIGYRGYAKKVTSRPPWETARERLGERGLLTRRKKKDHSAFVAGLILLALLSLFLTFRG